MRAAIVGCGSIARVHAQCISDIPEYNLTAVADIIPDRARLLADKYSAVAYNSLEDMLDDQKIDVLHICTPHYLHVPMSELAASKKIAVFMEKPPAITVEQWLRLLEISKKIPIGICFQNRYNKSIQYLKELVDSNTLGKIKGARAFVTWSRNAEYYTKSGWRGSRETEGGGVLINQSIHTMDLLVYLLGKPQLVDAMSANRHLRGIITVEDTFDAYIDFAGKPALFYASTAFCMDSNVILELCFQDAIVRVEDTDVSLIYPDGKKELKSFGQKADGDKAYWGLGHLSCIESFYSAMKAGLPPPISVESVKNTVELMLAAYQSAAEGIPVSIT